MSQLLRCLWQAVKSKNRGRDWPTTPEVLRHQIDRIRPSFEHEGVSIRFEKSNARGRERKVFIDATRIGR
jgi:hypothetical protein